MELDLNYNPPRGVSFDCSTCKKSTQKSRRCKEDRMDFTEKDDPSVFPIYVTKGSTLFSFCPAKATWDKQIKGLYRSLKIASESGNMWIAGGIGDQPEWWVDLLSWFLPRYNDLRFAGRVRGLLGDDPAETIRSLMSGSNSKGKVAPGGRNK